MIWYMYYGVCHGFRITYQDDYFLSHFWPLLKQVSFFDATKQVAKIGSSLKPNHHNQVKLVYSLKDIGLWKTFWVSYIICISIDSSKNPNRRNQIDFVELCPTLLHHVSFIVRWHPIHNLENQLLDFFFHRKHLVWPFCI